MRDIKTRRDLEFLLEKFYQTATNDELIGGHFADLDLASHIPVITDFWVKTLFGEPVYFGNPFLTHQKLNEKAPLLTTHFKRWLEVFCTTVDMHFAGETAEKAKSKASFISNSLDRQFNQDQAQIKTRPQS
ncbi:MAG: group III truncated hemoglobin [Acidobacteriota bacterium]|nr:group III truncated hemoglobin [Acidobacteriota bacterium]MDH3529003.1 group III truncated hemoglobin [Acidobacteriota bacterium]